MKILSFKSYQSVAFVGKEIIGFNLSNTDGIELQFEDGVAFMHVILGKDEVQVPLVNVQWFRRAPKEKKPPAK